MLNLDSLFKSYIQVMDNERAETNNCVLVAHVLNHIFSNEGIKNDICLGYAVWSVGKGNNDIITHLPNSMTQVGKELAGAVPLHAWIEIGEERQILDFTTYQLKKKGRLLEEADGLKTNVKWCPDYLFTTQDKLQSLNEIRKSKFAGKYGYQREKQFEEVMNEKDNIDSKNKIVTLANEILKLNNQ